MASSYQSLFTNGANSANGETFVCPQRDRQFNIKQDFEIRKFVSPGYGPYNIINSHVLTDTSLNKLIILQLLPLVANFGETSQTRFYLTIPNPEICLGSKLELVIIGDRGAALHIRTNVNKRDTFLVNEYAKDSPVRLDAMVGPGMYMDIDRSGSLGDSSNAYGVARIQKIIHLTSTGYQWVVQAESLWFGGSLAAISESQFTEVVIN